MNLICGAARRHLDPMFALTHYPSDKSISHRILMFAMLEAQQTVINKVNISGAITPLLTAMQALGVELQINGDQVVVGHINKEINQNGHIPYLNLGSSSTAARLLIGLLAGLGIEVVVDGDETLRPRPVDWVVDPLRKLGAEIEYLAGEGQLPVKIRKSKLHSGRVSLSVGSAQALSAVLYAAYAAGIDVEVEQKVRSRDHTQRLLIALGGEIKETANSVLYRYGPPKALTEYTVPADPSAIVYPLTAHLLSNNQIPLSFGNVCLNDTRTGYIELLKRSGADIRYNNLRCYWGESVGDVVLMPGARLTGFVLDNSFDFHAMIDEVPLAILLATQINGLSEFHGLAELTFKETNRITASQGMVNAFGATIDVQEYSVYVKGKQQLSSGVRVPSFRDHRLAMAASAVASGLGLTVEVTDGECFRTSFNQYLECFNQLGFDLKLATKLEVENEATIG